MTQDSLVTNLNAKGNGNIYLYGENNQLASSLPSYTGQTLIVDNLAGAGVFNFKTNIETTTTDFMVVNNDVMGTHRVEVQNDGAQKTTGEEILAIINTNNAVKDNAFYANRLVELGGYSYKFSRNSDNPEEWILSGSPKEEPEPSNPPKTVTSTGNAAASTIITTYLVNFIETQNLLKRMGQLNNSNVDSIGIWARAYTGNLSSFQGNLLKGFKMSYHTIQIGSDYFFPLDNAQMYIGGAVSYLDGSPRHDYYGKIGYIDDASKKSLIVGRGSSDGKIKSYSISLYGVYQNENHLYIDGLVKYSYMKNSFSVSDSAGLKVYGNDNSHAFSISAEIGQRFYFDSSKELGGYVTPQVQLVYSTFSAARYKATNGLVIKADKRGSLLGRIGVELGYKFAKNENTSGNIFTKFAYLREFSDDGAYWLNNSQEKYSFKGNWYQMEVGANVNFNKNHNIYGNLEFNKGNKFDQKQINIGYRYTF
ncbi:autotransporter outer membrane beta-barrel domain-containing protein [Wohlfahrtiimonas populi]